jgi:hypothetical protein
MEVSAGEVRFYRRHEEQVIEMRRRGWTGHHSPFPMDKIPPEERNAAIEVTDEMLERDRMDLAERKRLTDEAGGRSWRKAGVAKPDKQ